MNIRKTSFGANKICFFPDVVDGASTGQTEYTEGELIMLMAMARCAKEPQMRAEDLQAESRLVEQALHAAQEILGKPRDTQPGPLVGQGQELKGHAGFELNESPEAFSTRVRSAGGHLL